MGGYYFQSDPPTGRIFYNSAIQLRKAFYHTEAQHDIHRAVFNLGMCFSMRRILSMRIFILIV